MFFNTLIIISIITLTIYIFAITVLTVSVLTVIPSLIKSTDTQMITVISLREELQKRTLLEDCN